MKFFGKGNIIVDIHSKIELFSDNVILLKHLCGMSMNVI